MNKHTTLLLLLFLFLISCKSVSDLPVVNIDSTLHPYYDKFIQEALARNQYVARYPKSFSIKFGVVSGAEGRTFYETNTIIIDSLKWKNISAYNREFLIFHELGHLFLNREHDNTTLPNDEFNSIMLTYEKSPVPTNTLLYLGIRRKYYVDELFNMKPPIPDQGKRMRI